VLPALDCLDDVFRVHDAMIQSPQSDRLGGHAGWKLGWKGNPLVTADPSRLPAMYSPIFAGCLFPSGTTLSLSHHKVFCAEAEFGFVMGSPLPPREECYTQEEVWAAVRSYEPCIELCGARFTTATAKASPYHLLADAMNNAAVIRGIPLVPPPATPPAAALTGGSCLVRLLVDGKEASSGTGEENPADSPLGALTFLANDLSRRGKTLEAGHFVIAGHTCQVAFSSRPAPPSARTLSQAPVCGARVVPDAAVEFGAHSVLEAYHEGCGTVRAILVD